MMASNGQVMRGPRARLTDDRGVRVRHTADGYLVEHVVLREGHEPTPAHALGTFYDHKRADDYGRREAERTGYEFIPFGA